MRIGLRSFGIVLSFLCASGNVYAAVGRTLGSFDVSRTGSATYSIPIHVVPGPNGLQPNIALTYDSRGGYAFVGVGWSVSGLSGIYRCNATYAEDGTPSAVTLSYNDRFCMDGNKLRLTSNGENLSSYGQPNTTYQTEIADFSTVTALGTAGSGPASFTVVTKDGLRREYGNGGNSRIMDNGTAAAWLLDKVTDTAGNTMTIAYTAPDSNLSGATMPATISWTPTSYQATTYKYTMQFSYTPMTTPVLAGYLWGTVLLNNYVLTGITIADSGATTKNYVLGYTTSTTTGQQTLTSVKECADTAQTNCFAPTTITYQGGEAGIASPSVTAVPASAINVNAVDLDGDGRMDLVYAIQSGSSFHWYVRFSSPSGFGGAQDTTIVTATADSVLFDDFLGIGRNMILAPASGIWNLYSWNGSAFTATSTGQAVDANRVSNAFNVKYVSADINGDGLPDLIWAATDGFLHVRLNSTSSGTLSFGADVSSGFNYTQFGGTISKLIGNNTLAASSVKHMDFDGDGRQDVMAELVSINPASNKFFELMGRGTSLVFGNIAVATTSGVALPINWNDDGCTDLAALDPTAVVWLSACNGTPAEGVAIGNSSATAGMVADWNGDGRADFLQDVGGTWQVSVSRGNLSAPTISTGISAGTGSWVVLDQDGDGLDDIAFVNSSSGAVTYGVHNAAATVPDLAIQFKDGYQNSSSPTYVSIVQSNYTPGTTAQPGYINYLAPLYVVSQVTFSDPTNPPNGTYNRTFSYEAATMSVHGLGFTGFNTTHTHDSRTGLYDKIGYITAFPEIGILAYDQTTQDAAATQQVRIEYYNRIDTLIDSTAGNQRWFIYANRAVVQSNEISGAKKGKLISTVDTAYTYDNYGNPTNVNTTVTDGDAFSGTQWTKNTTITPFVDDPTYQSAAVAASCLTLAEEVQVQYGGGPAGTAAVSRLSSSSADLPHCRLTETVVEPSGGNYYPTYTVTEDFQYDNFGNIFTDKITGNGMASRTTTKTWGTTGQFPVTVTDPNNDSTQMDYNYDFGVLSKLTDPNGLITTWSYTDGFGRQTRMQRPDGTGTAWSYSLCSGCDPKPRMVVTEQPLNASGAAITSTNYYFDMLDQPLYRLSTLQDGSQAYTMVHAYDSLGRLVSESFPYRNGGASPGFISYGYDQIGRLTQIQRPISATNTTVQTETYTYQGDTTTFTDANSHQRVLIKDANGWMRQTLDASGYAIDLAYDAVGSKTGVTDSLGNTLWSGSYKYGIAPFQVTASDADMGPSSYTFDALGEIVAWQDAKGNQFSAAYDSLSRMTDRYEPDLYSHMVWGTSAAAHEIGHLHSACTGTGTSPTNCTASPGYAETDTYDAYGRAYQRSLQLPGEPTTYTYTSLYNASTGFLDSLTYPVSSTGYSLKVQYGYANGILNSITNVSDTPNVALWTANATNPAGQAIQETLGNHVIVNHSFDAVTGLVSNITAGVGGGATLQNNSYLFDGMGNLTQRQDNNAGVTENVFPDGLNRLDHTVGDTNTQLTYDSMGRLSTWAAYGGTPNVNDYSTAQPGCTYYSYSQPHAVRSKTQGTGVATYCYDANGNMTTSTWRGAPTTVFSWTSYNQPLLLKGGWPTLSDPSASSSQFFYDNNHQRWKQVASYSGAPETTVYIGGLLEKMTNASGTVFRHYIPAGNNLVLYARTAAGSAATYYITKGHLGSLAAVTDQNGALLVSEKYAALGWNENTTAEETTMGTITRHEFTGQEGLNNDGLFMTDFNGRLLMPSGSMFVSADPFIQDPTNTLSYNRYSYVEYNTLTNIDPSGYFNLGDLLNPFSQNNPFNPFGKLGRQLALLPFTSSLAALRFGQREGDSLLRDNTWLQPIAEIAACYWGGPWGCAGANAYLTKLNGGSTEDALIAGFVAYVDYGMEQGIDQDINGWAGKALLKGFIAGTSAEIMGGSFTRGFELAASFSIADSAYEHFTDHPPGWGPGEDRPGLFAARDALDSNNYTMADDYSVPPPFWNVNTFGFNQALTGDGSWTDCFTQSGACSSVFDKVPGLQAVSQLHDAWTNFFKVQSIWGMNVPTMLPAAVISYGSLLDQYGGGLGFEHGHGH